MENQGKIGCPECLKREKATEKSPVAVPAPTTQPTRSGAVRTLKYDDLSTKLVGWKPPLGALGMVNERGYGLVRCIVQKIENGEAKDLYDQPMLIESPGAIVVCEVAGKVGLVQNYRFTGPRLFEAGADYVKRLNQERRWSELFASLGQWQWELPRGLSLSGNSPDVAKYVLATAKAEALEESGLKIAEARICPGKINANTTFFAHGQYVVHGKIVGQGQAVPEDLEIIGRTKLFSGSEIRSMVEAGEIEDSFTVAALAIAGFRF